MELTNLNFHQTFPPDASMLSRLLTADVFDQALTKEEISQQTGIPTGKSSGKVEPHIDYASYMGLVHDTSAEGKHTLSLTPLGELVLSEDPGMGETVTRMVCYLRMSSPIGGAPLWEQIMAEILPDLPNGVSTTILKDILQRGMSKTININLSPFFSSFEEEMFSPLELMNRTSDTISLRPHRFDSDLVYVYAYALFREWENTFPGQDELTATEIESLLMPKSLGWKQTEFYAALERLQDKGLLQFNRQLVPYTVVKGCTSDDIVPRLYSELF